MSATAGQGGTSWAGPVVGCVLLVMAAPPAAAQAPPSELVFSSRAPAPLAPPRARHRVAPSLLAFERELRSESIRYRDRSPWAIVPDGLQQDRPVREARERAAEKILGDAVEAGAEELLARLVRPARFRDARAEPRSAVHARVHVDANPSLSLRGGADERSLRVDIPLTAHEEVRFRWSRRVDTDRTEIHVGASVAVDPWEGSVRAGVACSF